MTDAHTEAVAVHQAGVTLAAGGKLAEAVEQFRRAVELNPSFARAQFNLGLALRRLGHHDEAATRLRLAMQLAPQAAEPIVELVGLLADRGEDQQAIELIDAASTIPALRDNDRIHATRGFILKRLGRLEDAAAALQTAVTLSPRSVQHRSNLALVLMELGRADEADRQIAPMLASSSAPPPAIRLRAAMMLPRIARSLDEMLARRRRFESTLDEILSNDVSPRDQIADPMSGLNSVPFYLAYAGLDDRAILEKLAAVHRRLCPSLEFVAPHCLADRGAGRASPAGRRIRIGIASTTLYSHTIGRLNVGWIEKLDRKRFELFIFDLSRADEMSRRILSAADHAVRCPAGLADLRQTIAGCELDVLLFPDIGMTPLTYYLAFARLAPVQCVTWGHPVTSGLSSIDYFISAQHLETSGSESHYVERLHRFSMPGTYYVRPAVADLPDARSRFGLERDWHIYLCPQSLFKIHPEFDSVLAKILRADAAARIVLVAGNDAATARPLLDRFRESMGDDVNRLVVLPKLSTADFLALLTTADANLDTFHFGGGHTSLEAFAVGSPVVTLPSQFLRGRITYALYRQMDVTRCIATSVDDYVQKALRLAQDRRFRDEMRDAIVANRDRIFENRQVVEEFEAFFERASG